MSTGPEALTLVLDMDKTCLSCGAMGALPNGRCLTCAARALSGQIRAKGARMAEFLGRPVSRETISLGLGGQIDRAGEEFPPLSLVTFKATAKVSSIKHKFLGDGTVEEMLILVIDPESFRVVDIHEQIDEQEKLPLSGASQ